ELDRSLAGGTSGRVFEVEGKRGVGTGASRGVGVHIARALAVGGADLLVVARSETELVHLAKERRTPGNKVAVAAIDLAGPRAADQVSAGAAAELGDVDVLVNN